MMNRFRTALLGAAFAVPLALTATPAAALTAVGLELSLVIDISGSVDSTEYDLQRAGYASAFLAPAVQAGILALAGAGGVAINVIQFGSNAIEVVPWTVLDSAADADAFSAVMAAMARSGSVGSSTDVEDGMALAISGIAGNDYDGVRKVIDVSGDGHQNTDTSCNGSSPFNIACAIVQDQRDIAAAMGIRINGLPIEGDYAVNGLTTWYNTNVKTADGFVVTATFATFESAVLTKLAAEINNTTPTPEPASMAVLGMGLVGLAALRRRRRG